MAKASIEDDSLNIAVLYLDEIGRASRDTIEALRLGQLIAIKKKRLIGVSDGFDSDSEMSKIMLSIFAAVQEWFIDQLRSKVYRGIDTENMTYKETDPETGDITIKERPRKEWWVRRARNLKIVSHELWKKTRRRLAESAQAYAGNGKATNRKVREAEAVGAAPSPINLEDVLLHLGDLRGLLNQDVAQAEPVLREITGPVVVHIRVDPGNQRKTWIAEFNVNLVPVVAMFGWSDNSRRIWTARHTR